MPVVQVLTAAQVTVVLHKSLRTLHRWRAEGRGPTAFKIADRWHYRKDEVEQFVTDKWRQAVLAWPEIATPEPREQNHDAASGRFTAPSEQIFQNVGEPVETVAS